MKALLKDRKADAKATGKDRLFAGLTQRQVNHYWERLSVALDLHDDRQFVPHILRHEFCSRLADLGMNAAVIQKLAGHSTLAVTQRYIHVRAESLVDAIERLEGTERDWVPSRDSGTERGTDDATGYKIRDITPRRSQQDQALRPTV